jgi:hypothetical protein
MPLIPQSTLKRNGVLSKRARGSCHLEQWITWIQAKVALDQAMCRLWYSVEMQVGTLLTTKNLFMICLGVFLFHSLKTAQSKPCLPTTVVVQPCTINELNMGTCCEKEFTTKWKKIQTAFTIIDVNIRKHTENECHLMRMPNNTA